MILCGRDDPQFPLTGSRRLREGIVGSRLVLFERSGHYPFIEEPDALWAAVAGFLSPATATV